MYVEQSGNWRVEPEQVREFAAAVDQVRRDLEAIASEVQDLSTPDYAPMLGTSPVGQELAEKFTDRMGSAGGLRGQLEAAMKQVDDFVTSAQHTAAEYLQVDADNQSKFKFV
jgi:outer membrane murein-binding lipoprotein Lpp